MAAWLNVCRFTPTLGGTTDWTYSAAVTGYQSPALAGVVNGRLYKYRAESADLSQWELGEGTYNTGTGVLARTTVTYNSSGTGTGTGQSGAGTKINFSTVPQVAVVALKEDLLAIEEANAFSATQQAQARSNIFAAPFDAMGYTGMQINGAMEVSQENVGNQFTFGNVTPAYIADGFISIYAHTAATAVIKGQQIAPPGSPSFGLAFQNCIQVTSTTAFSSPGVGDIGPTIYQLIEGYRWMRLGFGNANGQSVTIGFWIYATIAGTATLSIRNNAINRSYLSNFTINNATTWEYKTITVPPETTGAWLTTNGVGAYVAISSFAGSNFQSTNGAWNTGNFLTTSSTTNFFVSNNNVMCLTGFGIWPGSEAPNAARSPFIMRPYDQELILCQRYLRKSFPRATAIAQNAGIAGAVTIKNPIALGDPSEIVYFSPTMRATPVITTYNPSAANANWRDITAASDVTVSVDPGGVLNDSSLLLATSGTVTTLGDILGIHYKADARL